MALLLCPEMITALVDVDSSRKILATDILKMCVRDGKLNMFHSLCKCTPWSNQCYTTTCYLLFTVR